RRRRNCESNQVLPRVSLFGLLSRRRTESILLSMPPTAGWRYEWHPDPGTPAARLQSEFLVPRVWACAAPPPAERPPR
ncbi:coproporphyrinogen III oxidase, partial [Burkholderia pseudomallei]